MERIASAFLGRKVTKRELRRKFTDAAIICGGVYGLLCGYARLLVAVAERIA